MLAHRLRRWANIKPTLGQCLVIAGVVTDPPRAIILIMGSFGAVIGTPTSGHSPQQISGTLFQPLHCVGPTTVALYQRSDSVKQGVSCLSVSRNDQPNIQRAANKLFISLKPECQSGVRTCDLRCFRQAALTTAPIIETQDLKFETCKTLLLFECANEQRMKYNGNCYE